ncbi:RRP12-like protein [Leptotrombidium deliense]|uniref:RRP12-like protein n=1 Tax=Leptotrombidium deliense TaxID=299467 RepID=A0A443SJP1_9ACAR|nr:RRP12-like protein [Leptotrombidium deliense]
MRIAKKATKGKGKLWKRGESSSSNPTTNKFRKKAKTSICKPETDSNFTVDALEAHNVLMLNNCSLSDESDVKSEAESFASMWSNCSNPSFDRLLNNWQSTSLLHKEMLAVLGAVTEIIKERGGKETETEYFATLMTTLEGIENEESLTATVCLINMVVRRLPSAILKCKFSESTDVFRKYITDFVAKENSTLLRCLISCVAVFLRAQETAVWKMTSTQQVYQEILSLTTHQKPRVRKAAHKAVVAVLKGSAIVTSGQVSQHPVASLTAKFCTKMIEETRIGDSISLALQMLNLMKDLLAVLPTADIKNCCETILRMMTLGNVLVVTTSLKVFHNFFLTQSNSDALNCDLNLKIIMALYDHQPSVNDSQPLCAWLVVMKQAHICLFLKNREQFLRQIPKLVKASTACWLSDASDVFTAVEDCLEAIITVCLREVANQISINAMREVFSSLEKCLSYQYVNAWGSLFHVFALLFEVFGPQYPEAFKSILKNLSELRESYGFKFISELESAIGYAVKYMGTETVLEAIPLTLDLETLNLNRSWLIPVLRDNVFAANLGLFASLFMSYSQQIEHKIEELNKSGNSTQTKICEVLNDQIWSLLPSFCNKPKDLTTSFRVIARSLGHVLRSNEQLRAHVLKALRVLIVSNMDNDVNKTELSSYAKNFLPILLRLYTSKDTECTKEVRLSILETVKVYLSISDKETINEQYTNLINNLDKLKTNENEDQFRKEVLHDVLRVFIPFVEDVELILRDRVIPLINDKTDKKCQKKGYQLIEVIVKTANKNVVDACLDLLVSSFPKVSDSAKFAPLRSLKFIIENNLITDEKQNSELCDCSLKAAIKSLCINSTKTKNSAFDLIICLTKKSSSAFCWLRCMPKDKCFPFILIVIDSLNAMDEETHKQFRFKVKEVLTSLIRKFSFEVVAKFVPEKYSKVLKSIRKLEARKNKEKNTDDDSTANVTRSKKGETIDEILCSSDDESDGDRDEISQVSRKRQKLNTYIAEDKEDGEILDLLGKNTSQMIFSTNPEMKKSTATSTVNFDTAQDGRLIIEDIDEKKGVKRKSMDDSDEEEGDDNEPMQEEKPQYRPGGKGIHRDVNSLKKGEKSVSHNLGEEYRSKKAKGDMKRKGRPDPYAYVPLNPQALNKRKAAKFRGQFKNIVRAAKSGAQKGSKSNQKMKKHSKMNKKHK